jgi:hypothetical protein
MGKPATLDVIDAGILANAGSNGAGKRLDRHCGGP